MSQTFQKIYINETKLLNEILQKTLNINIDFRLIVFKLPEIIAFRTRLIQFSTQFDPFELESIACVFKLAEFLAEYYFVIRAIFSCNLINMLAGQRDYIQTTSK